MVNAIRDGNHVTVGLGVSSSDSTVTLPLKVDPATGRLLVDNASASSGTVTDVSVVTANGVSGSVANSTTTPAITLTLGNITPSGVQVSGLTASEIVITDGSKNLVSAAVATYPSLTELTYVKGVTSAIQTQLNGKLANVVEDTTPQLGGTLDLNGQNITNSTTFKYDATNARLSVGTDTQTVSIDGATALGVKIGSETEGATDLVDYLAHRHSDTAGFGGHVLVGRSRGTNASPTVVQSGDTVARVVGIAYDGTNWQTTTSIDYEIDGTPGANDMPGRIVFKTTPDGSKVLAEAMRISNDKTVRLASLTASEIVITDASKNLVSAAVATYPSLTELTYVKGVTSAIQTQLNGKAATLSGTTNEIAYFDSSSTISSLAVATYPSLTELSYVKGVTSAIQTQLGNKLALAGGTMTGSITLGENTSIALDPAGSADGKYTGITVTGTSGYTQAFGDLVYLDPTDSRWEAVDANAASGADGDARGMLGMVVSTGTDGNACTILLNGIIRADAKFPTFTVNNPIYVSETAGAVTQTQPTTTDVVIRIVGSALTADEMYFNPDWAWVTHV